MRAGWGLEDGAPPIVLATWSERHQVREGEAQPSDAERRALAAFKAGAASGDDVAVPDRYVLGRCLEETLRLTPPVWTLARELSSDQPEGRHLKLDVLSVNSEARRPGASPRC